MFNRKEKHHEKISICMNSSWLDRKISDLTLEDAMAVSNDGFSIVCGDGKVVAIIKEK